MDPLSIELGVNLLSFVPQDEWANFWDAGIVNGKHFLKIAGAEPGQPANEFLFAVKAWRCNLPEGKLKRRFVRFSNRFMPLPKVSMRLGQEYFHFGSVAMFESFLHCGLIQIDKLLRVNVVSEGHFQRLCEVIQMCPDLDVSVNCVVSGKGNGRWPGKIVLSDLRVRFTEICLFAPNVRDGRKVLHPKSQPWRYKHIWPLAAVVWKHCGAL